MEDGLTLLRQFDNTLTTMYNYIMSRKPIYTPEQKKLKQAEWVAKWRKNNPEKQKLARQRAYDNRKRKAFDMVGGAKCVRCGCDELHALEFNHKNGNGAREYRNNNNRAMMDMILTFKRNTDDLEVLCRVCNAVDFIERKIPTTKGKFTVSYND